MIRSSNPSLSPSTPWLPSLSSLSDMSSDEEHAEQRNFHSELIIKDVNSVVTHQYSVFRSQPVSPTQTGPPVTPKEHLYNRLVAQRRHKQGKLIRLKSLLEGMEQEKHRLKTDDLDAKVDILESEFRKLKGLIWGLESDDEKYKSVVQRCELTNETIHFRSMQLQSSIDDISSQISNAQNVILIDENLTSALIKQTQTAFHTIQSMRLQRTEELSHL